MIRVWKCDGCGWKVDVLTHGGVSLAMAPLGCADEPWAGKCFQCGSEAMVRQLTVPKAIGLGDVGGQGRLFPYFDRGLRTMVNSRAHRAQICKARGVVPVDGTIDLEADACRRASEEQKARDEWRELQTMYEEHPDFASYREARDKGAIGATLQMKQPWRQKSQLPRIL